jgi:hypothetical protein
MDFPPELPIAVYKIQTNIKIKSNLLLHCYGLEVMVFNTTFNNISVI